MPTLLPKRKATRVRAPARAPGRSGVVRDPGIGATKPANSDGRPSAELVERRAGAEGNAGQDRTRRAQNRASVSKGLDRVRHVLPSHTQGGSRVPELGPLGSVRGALSNGRPYRDLAVSSPDLCACGDLACKWRSWACRSAGTAG